MQSRSIWLLIGLAALAACEQTTISGSVRVIDGDSLEIGATSIRIHGIDAPEGRQRCLRDGTLWNCGEAASTMLENLVAARTITCVETDIDDYGRTVARCNNGDVDLGAAIVRAGLALAYRQYGLDYVGEEAEAEAARAGIWAGTFTPPWEWRRNPVDPPYGRAVARTPERGPVALETGPVSPEQGQAGVDRACRIKGNINRDGERIYHLPGTHSYEQTRIDVSRGERWFCSEAEARREGWRAPRG